MQGFQIAEAGHVVNLVPPVSTSGTVTSLAFAMNSAYHVAIIIDFGAGLGFNLPTSITLNQCSTAARSA